MLAYIIPLKIMKIRFIRIKARSVRVLNTFLVFMQRLWTNNTKITFKSKILKASPSPTASKMIFQFSRRNSHASSIVHKHL